MKIPDWVEKTGIFKYHLREYCIMYATLKVRKNGMTTIPIEVREALDIREGDLVVVDIVEKRRPPVSSGAPSS